jgi:hypothetical protein
VNEVVCKRNLEMTSKKVDEATRGEREMRAIEQRKSSTILSIYHLNIF